jgi:hypothetical protein
MLILTSLAFNVLFLNVLHNWRIFLCQTFAVNVWPVSAFSDNSGVTFISNVHMTWNGIS